MSSLCAVLVYITCKKYGEREVIMVGMREGFDTGMIPQVLCEDFGDFSRSRSPFLRACQTAGRHWRVWHMYNSSSHLRKLETTFEGVEGTFKGLVKLRGAGWSRLKGQLSAVLYLPLANTSSPKDQDQAGVSKLLETPETKTGGI